jgi:GT2 family glycosyltransferase
MRLVADVKAQRTTRQLRVVVVDNSESEQFDQTLSTIPDHLVGAVVLKPGANLGYFGGARFAMERLCSLGITAPNWVILSNPDIRIRDVNFCERLLAVDHTAVGMVAPQILSEYSGCDLNPFIEKRLTPTQVHNLQMWFSSYALYSGRACVSRVKCAAASAWQKARRRLWKRGEERRERSIYSPHGSFLIFSRRFFDSGGSLDEKLFLYGEEIAVAESCRVLGLPIIYRPQLMVVHREHETTGRCASRRLYEMERDAHAYLRERYFAGR